MTLPNKRILHFIESEGVYGAERVILNLSQQLLKEGSFVPVVGCIVTNTQSHSPLYEAALSLGIEAIKIPIANKTVLLDLPKAARQLKTARIDLIHSHGYKPSVFGFIINLLTRIPVMATCHLWFEPSKGPLKMKIMIGLEKFFYRWFPKIVAVSEPIKNILLHNNLRPEQVILIRNGVDLPTSNMGAEEKFAIRQSLGIQENEFCVLNSARLNRQKAQWVLIKAAKIIKLQQQHVKILIVGEGPLHHELTDMIKAEGVENYVQLMGFRDDVYKLLSISDLFCLPSIDEGMPMSLLEAAAACKPIITTSVGDIPKLIQHEKTGLIITLESPEALASAILRLKTDSNLAKQLAHNSHQAMVANYSSEAMCTAYLPIYHSLMTAQRA